MHTARPDSWQRRPFGRVANIPYHARFGPEDFDRLRIGLIPREMEDKWFAYFADPSLFLHRSWTGIGVYRVDVEQFAGGAQVTQAFCAADVLAESSAEYQARLLSFLISNLILGRSEPFPIPEGEQSPAVYQHVISGSGYPPVEVTARRSWWNFWRK